LKAKGSAAVKVEGLEAESTPAASRSCWKASSRGAIENVRTGTWAPAKVIEGHVEMDGGYALEPDELNAARTRRARSARPPRNGRRRRPSRRRRAPAFEAYLAAISRRDPGKGRRPLLEED